MTSVTADVKFAIVPEWVYANPKLSAGAVRLYCALSRRADGDGVTFPSRNLLATEIHVSLATVKRLKRELLDVGAISQQERFAGGRQTSNTYVIHRGVTADPQGGVTADPGGGVVREPGAAPGGGGLTRPTTNETQTSGAERLQYGINGAQPFVKLYVDTLNERGVTQYPKSHPARVGKEVKQLLADGIDETLIQAAVQAAARRNVPPTAIPYIVMEVQAPATRRNGKMRYGRGVTPEMIDEVLRIRREHASGRRGNDRAQTTRLLPRGDT